VTFSPASENFLRLNPRRSFLRTLRTQPSPARAGAGAQVTARGAGAWAELADAAKNIYRSDVTFAPNISARPLARPARRDGRRHRRHGNGFEAEIGGGKTALKIDSKIIEQAMRAVLEKTKQTRPPPAEFHAPPDSFQRGQPLNIVVQRQNFPACDALSPRQSGRRLADD